jgi:hypothetical protein
MTKTKGNVACMKISTTAGGASGYNAIELMTKMGGPESVDTVDTTMFNCTTPPTYKENSQTLNSADFVGECFSDYANATNQRKLWDNLENDIETWIQWYYDGVHYRKARVEVADITFTVKKNDFNRIAFNAKSTGTISYGT